MEGQPSNLKAENMAIRLPNESVEEKLRGDSVANRITELVEERIRGNSTRTEFDAAEEKIVRGGARPNSDKIKLYSSLAPTLFAVKPGSVMTTLKFDRGPGHLMPIQVDRKYSC